MKFILLTIIAVLFFPFHELYSQDTSDAERLAALGYMKLATKINCDSTSGSNIEHRICLNLEFQKLDSILNKRFITLVQAINNDSIKRQIIQFQKSWVTNRRTQCRLISEGLQGHLLGIYYLGCMVETTRLRSKEITYLIETK